MDVVRAWSSTCIDGRNVLAMPTKTEIRLYDSDEFILLSHLQPSGHDSSVALVRWSAFHGRLASLSAEFIIVHAPQRDQKRHSSVQFAAICCYQLDVVHANIRSLSFSRSADELLFCGRDTRLGKLNVRAQGSCTDHDLVLWETNQESCDMAKYSPSAFVFATLRMNETQVKIWRMRRRLKDADECQTLDRVEMLQHADPVVYFAWKPSTTQWHSPLESDGTRKAQWFEPSRILLTSTANRTVTIWTESLSVSFEPVLAFEPAHSIENLCWVIPKTTNARDENCKAANDGQNDLVDWISGVNRKEVLRFWRLVGVTSESPKVEETSLQIKINGDDDRHDGNIGMRLRYVCVMAYFTQNYVGIPSKLSILLQRVDHIMMSFHVTVGEGDQPPEVMNKSWYRGHLGSISALSAHPSLPLIASVDTYTFERDSSARNDILVYWISFSAFSVESRLIPSGVLPCRNDSGKVLCIQWVPTLHFDATPLLLVAFESGVIDIYGRASLVNATGVSSPKVQMLQQQLKNIRFPSLTPSTLDDRVKGKLCPEYEVVCRKPNKSELDIQFEESQGILLVVPNRFSRKHLGKAIEGDELVGINSTRVVGKEVEDVWKLIDLVSLDESFVMRFRAACMQNDRGTIRLPACETSQFVTRVSTKSTCNSSDLHASMDKVKGHVSDVRRNVVPSLEKRSSRSPYTADNVNDASVVSMYGGWRQSFHMQVASKLSLLYICPCYADDGEYMPDAILILGLESIPGKLCVWKGVRDSACQSFNLVSLQIQEQVIEKKANVTSIASERDYRQRAFSGKRGRGYNSLYSLLFVGDAAGNIEHWRCQVVANFIYITVMSSHLVCGNRNIQQPVGHQLHELSGSFCRRGYVFADQAEDFGQSEDPYTMIAGRIKHIEVDDPNRVAVLQADWPDQLYVFEAESGLGILRLEECILSNGRGNILYFSWCNSHVEFNVNALAIRYQSATVIYHYDTTVHRWTQVGDDIVSPLPLFDCTRDSSALLIGGGRRNGSQHKQPSFQPISNEMPVIICKWDEPESLLQKSMDWKSAESSQKLPVWHPYVLLTTTFGMHARVGKKDTVLAGDSASYEFFRAFKDATQMLKLLAKVLEDEHSARASATSGVLSYAGPIRAHETSTKHNEIGRARLVKSVGRYSTSIHRSNKIDKAENLFADPLNDDSDRGYKFDEVETSPDENDQRTLASNEAAAILAALDSILLGKAHMFYANASMLFASFSEEHFLEMKALISFVDTIQSLNFDLDASAADLGAKRFFSMHLFSKSLRSIMLAHISGHTSPSQNGDSHPFSGKLLLENLYNECESDFYLPSLEIPSSGLLWALHSDAQEFLCEHCIEPRMQWNDIRPFWLGLWIKDVKDLRGIVERLAKVSFTRTKNALDVCLLYVALGKKKVLSALANITQSESNKVLALFLDNDFSEKRWTDAAIKNAYSLLSKKKYELAASFFLLCDPPRIQDAIRVLSVRLGDLSLAIIVSRLVEHQVGDRPKDAFVSSRAEITAAGPITKRLLEQDVIPFFRRKREVWLESCALWWLEDFERAWAVLLPQFQDADVCKDNELTPPITKNLVTSVMRATHFYINLTSLTLYFQHLHSSMNSSLLRWAKIKLHQQVFPDAPVSLAPVYSDKRRLQLASTTDIEHAFSFAAYVCKRNGLSDTALVNMLQARQLINLHARFETLTTEDSIEAHGDTVQANDLDGLAGSSISPRIQLLPASWRHGKQLSNYTSPTATRSRQTAWKTSRRRMSFIDEVCLPHMESCVVGKKPSRCRSRASSFSWSKPLQFEMSIQTVPWLKAQIADIECRRWSSSAFVGKMIGIRVAREMISHFCAELDMWFRHGDDTSSPIHATIGTTTSTQQRHYRVDLHKEFLNELCTPLCEQFQVDRNYVYEAALAVMYPHAYLHIVEICFLLSELGKASSLCKWVEYVSLSMIHSCSTFASCSVAEDVYQDWESLTIQLCYALNLDAQGEICIPHRVIAYVSAAVRTGVIFLGLARKRSDIVRQAVTLPFYTNGTTSDATTEASSPSLSSFAFEINLRLLRRMLESPVAKLRETRTSQIFEERLGYTFLGAFEARQASGDNISLLSWGGVEKSASQSQLKRRKMYTLILLVSVLRSLYAKTTVFLGQYHRIDEDSKEDTRSDIESSLFTPQKLWKTFGKDPLEGIKRWYELIESHLRSEFDYSVKDTPCLCGLYGLDRTAFKAGASRETKQQNCQGDLNDSSKESASFVRPGNSTDTDCDTKMTIAKVAAKETFGVDDLNYMKAFTSKIGINLELHSALVNASDDYVLLLMQNSDFGVHLTLRRFRLDPRVYVKSFVLRDAFSWFSRHQIFTCNTKTDTNLRIHAFLSRCCKQRKLRLLVTHRGEDTQMFPSNRNHCHSHQESPAEISTVPGKLHPSRSHLLNTARPYPNDALPARLGSAYALKSGNTDALPEDLYLQSMMFVNPWEVEAEVNVRRYIHHGQSPLHVELGWDRVSPICLETCDGIVDSVFKDPDLVTLWKITGGERWLVRAITQYQLGSFHLYRTLHQHNECGLAGQEEPKIPFLVEIYSRSQRNTMFEEAGLPHRFVGVVTVELVEATDLISCSWLGTWCDAYVFLKLSHSKDHLRETAEEWSLQTYRSPVGKGGVNPRWSTAGNKYVYRFAIPTHGSHTFRPTRGVRYTNGGDAVDNVDLTDSRMALQVWNADVDDRNRTAVNALEKLLPSVFSGPPAMLRCTVYQKNKVLNHQFMGRAQVSLDELTSSNQLDCWLPLEDTASGSLHVRISLSFQLMCSFMLAQP